MSLPTTPPTIGTTVTIRARTPVGPVTVVGIVLAASDQEWSLRRRDGGVVTVAVTDIDASRVVPPGRSQQIGVPELARICALGWRALETERLGEWQLRASGGYTGRANSCLTVGSPGMPLDAALVRVREWYRERGLPPKLQVHSDLAELPATVSAAGWMLGEPPVLVMTAEVAHVLRAGEKYGDPRVGLSDSPDPAWISLYRGGAEHTNAAALAVLANHPDAIFATIRLGGEPVAVARVAVDGKWAGVFGVEVTPAARRTGLGAAVTVAGLREAGRRGARQTYLQVFGENTGAIQLYERLNFTRHHTYRYATPT